MVGYIVFPGSYANIDMHMAQSILTIVDQWIRILVLVLHFLVLVSAKMIGGLMPEAPKAHLRRGCVD
jgi:hypothetical protein